MFLGIVWDFCFKNKKEPVSYDTGSIQSVLQDKLGNAWLWS